MKFVFKILISSTLILLVGCEELDQVLDTRSPRDKVEGQWSCNENSSIYDPVKSTMGTYEVYISKHPSDSTKIIIDNFYQLGWNVEVVASINNRTITIGNQTTLHDFTILSGQGDISSNYKKITWTYRVSDGAETDNVTAEYNFMY